MPALTSLISFRGLMLACTRKRRIPSHGGDKGHRGDKGPPGDKDDFSGTLKSVFDWEVVMVGESRSWNWGGGFRFQGGVLARARRNPLQETLPLACLHWVLRRVGHKDPRLKSCTRRRENPMVSCQREPQDSWVTWWPTACQSRKTTKSGDRLAG